MEHPVVTLFSADCEFAIVTVPLRALPWLAIGVGHVSSHMNFLEPVRCVTLGWHLCAAGRRLERGFKSGWIGGY